MLNTKLLIFKIGKGKYAFDTTHVDRIIKFENLTYIPSTQKTLVGLYNHEGNVIKIYSLAKRLGVESQLENAHKKIIIVKNNDVLVGIVVDEVLEVFNYNKDNFKNRSKITQNSDNNMEGLDFKYVKDMVLINDEIIIYLSVPKIVKIELEESKS